MVLGLISVGLFWGILIYYTQINGGQQKMISQARKMFTSQELFKRKLKKYCKTVNPFSRVKQNQQETENEGKNQMREIQLNDSKVLQQNSSGNKFNIVFNKTKTINKRKQTRNQKMKRYRTWLTSKNKLNTSHRLDPENSQIQILTANKPPLGFQNNSKQNEQFILQQIQSQSSDSIQNYQIGTQTLPLNKLSAKYNPFQFQHQQN